MAIYGVGAYYEEDVSASFIQNGIVGVGWGKEDAPELQEYFKSLKVGDIVYIKAAFGGAPNITVKGKYLAKSFPVFSIIRRYPKIYGQVLIGIIRDNVVRYAQDTNDLVSTGRNVVWLNTEHFAIPRPQEKNNVRSNTVYEKFHPAVQKEIITRITENA